MNARRWWCLVAALSLIGACGGDDEEAVVYSPEELGAALLTAADIGTDWTEEHRLVFDSREEGAPAALDPGMWCPAAEGTSEELAGLVADGGAFVELLSSESTRAGGADGRSFHGVTEQLWSGPDAEAYVDAAAVGLATCTGETWDLEDATVTLSALDGDEVGDQSTMALVTYVTPGPDGDYAWRGRQLVARVGATVMLVQELDVQLVDSDPRFTDDDWQRIVDTAAERVEALGDD